MERKKVYDAILFRQRQGSPLHVAFAASSAEIDSWARVPTKRTGNIRNFQRAEIPTHVHEVEQFFSNSANASPTAVVVGFDPIRAEHRVSTMVAGSPVNERDLAPGKPILGTIEISWFQDEDPQTSDQLITAIVRRAPQLRNYIYAELNDITGLTSDQLDPILGVLTERLLAGERDLTEANEEAEEEPRAEAEEGPVPEPELNLPPELRSKLAGLSPSEQQVVVGRLDFLAQTNPDILRNAPADDLLTLYREVTDELKPGILIDGQHRIKGTTKLGNIPFLVTALPLAPWPELAFQFIVTNRTAKKVAESLLISIVGNSLSRRQRAEIEERLREAGIRVGLIEAVMRVHEDELSPFYNMLAFGLKKEAGFLDAAAMRGKVIQLWYERVPPVLTLFDHLCKGKRRTERTEFWQSEELWFQMFVALWTAVKERYQGSAVFSTELKDKAKKIPASRLMTATVLKIFQETVLLYLEDYVITKGNTEGVAIAQSIPNEQKFSELVKNSLTRLTPDFFEGWALTGFDGSKGARDDLQGAILKVIKGEKTPAQLKSGKNPHRLFRGEG